ncbi:YcfA-like protein [Phocoenobacter uteri]|uniref:YcfA-like protein n=1 Tax=Phocoenobacter uteri TaxID=146806 RepID=A0A379DEQ0_9PAST|nr:type II toxin-antitoxin system HicA family toxin [Phocoenobacter uteri]MDG6881038.1 toxin HicA [Phocoenobacter uteri]PID51502.1 MAG: toxin HicA [Pasteurellales bacterium]SUB59057.1 YcfA-like protein [Phocoenobacter uteri]SUB76456.1 YcfA-like protein [Phocoenobacter uteri]
MHSRDLIKELKAIGCYQIRSGKGDHHIWYSPKTGKKFPITHPVKDIPIGTLRSIKKSAGLL